MNLVYIVFRYVCLQRYCLERHKSNLFTYLIILAMLVFFPSKYCCCCFFCFMIKWRRKCQLSSVLLGGEFHGQRNQAGYSPWDHKESDTTVRLFQLSSTLAFLIHTICSFHNYYQLYSSYYHIKLQIMCTKDHNNLAGFVIIQTFVSLE